MQLYALDEHTPILAEKAQKRQVYICPECQGLLRVRSGPFKQPHFYHTSSTQSCRQSQKSLEHIQLQLKLLSLLKEAQMETPFPSIGRIADIAWHEKKFIFEVQCSPISLEEAHSRCADYEQMGYTVLWILHDKTFNQKRLSESEQFLRSRGAFFTNSNKKGEGVIYDQFDIVQDHKRLFRGAKLPINPLEFSLPPSLQKELPSSLSLRLSQWKYTFEGDLLFHAQQEGALPHLLNLEHKLLSSQSKRLPFPTLLAKGYQALINWLLKQT